MQIKQTKFPTCAEIIEILKAHPEMTAFEKPLFSPERIMMLLQYRNLDLLKQQFQLHPQGINLQTFLWLMKHSIPYNEEQKYEFFYSLTKLFKEIDINNNSFLQWDEFITYIIEAVKESHNSGYQQNASLTQQRIIQTAYALKTKSYLSSDLIKDTTHDRASPIKQMVYVPFYNSMLSLEQQQNFIRFYDMDLKQRVEDRLTFIGTASIVSFEITDDTLIIIMSNKIIYFYEFNDLSRKFQYWAETIHLIQQVKATYLPLHKIIAIISTDGKLRTICKPEKRYKKRNQNDLQGDIHAHEMQITAVRQIANPLCVVTSSMDGTVKLWDISTKNPTLVTIMRDPAIEYSLNRGIRDIDISYNSSIITWGFQAHLSIWAPYISTVRPYVGQLKGNNTHMIVSARCIPDTSTVISIDNKNLIRIWDIKKSECVQVLFCQSKSEYILITPQGFIVFGRKMVYYQKSKQLRNLNEKKKIIPTNILFNQPYSLFIVSTAKQIRLYNAKNGYLVGLYNELFQSTHDSTVITAFCESQTSRKLYVGNSEGSVSLIDLKNGATLKTIRDANQQDIGVSNLLFYSKQNILMVLSDQIQNYEDGLFQSTLVKILKINNKQDQITHIAFNEQTLVYLTSCFNYFILWSFETSHILYVETLEEEITDLKFLPQYSAFIVSCKNKLYLYSYDQIIQEYQLLCCINTKVGINCILLNRVPQKKQHKFDRKGKNFTDLENNIINHLLEAKRNIQDITLFIGHVEGSISVFNFMPLIEVLKLKKSQKKVLKFFNFKRFQRLSLQKIIYSMMVSRTALECGQINNFEEFSSAYRPHSQPIIKLAYVKQLNCLSTCSLDGTIKLVNFEGIQLCHLDVDNLQVKQWEIPNKWIDVLIKGFDEVIDLVANLQKKSISEKERDNVKSKFLVNIYFNEQQKHQLYGKIRKESDNIEKKKAKQNNQKLLINSKRFDIIFKEVQTQMEIDFKKMNSKPPANNSIVKQREKISTKFSYDESETEDNKTQQTQLEQKKRSEINPFGLSKKKIINVSAKQFIKNIRTIKLQRKSSNHETSKKTQILMDTICKRGQSMRLMRTATKLAVNQYYATSEKNSNMNLLLATKMGDLFESFTKYKK